MTDKQVREAVYRSWIDGIRLREEVLGLERLPDGPTSDSLEELLFSIESVVFRLDSTPIVPEVADLMRNIEVVVDSWIFPERDPVGNEVVDFLTDMHRSLGISVGQVVPELSELQQRTDSLRAVSQAVKRSLAMQQENKPSGTIWSKVLSALKRNKAGV